MVDGIGKPFFIQGDTPWSLISQCTTAEQDIYLTDRASRGFNAAFCFVIDHMFCTYAPNNIYNEPPFTGANFITPNEAYFARVDSLISKAQQLGICMFLAPLYIGYPGTEEGWDTEIAAASTDDMASWGTYLGNRYKNYPNIVWVLGGDRDATAWLTKANAFANALVAADPNHLVTFHDIRGNMAISNLAGASWCTLNDIYSTYLATTTLAHTAYSNSPIMPYIQIEGYYEGESSMTDQQLRAQAYWTILGGGCGHMFGNNPVWGFTYLDANWATYLGSDGAIGMTRWASLFRSKAWYNLVPDYAHSVLTVGYGTEGNADYAACGRVADGSLIMI